MRYRIHQIKLNIDEGHDGFEKAIKRKLKRKDLAISDITIAKESIDARKKPDVKLVYSLDFSCDEKLPLDEAVVKDYDAANAEFYDAVKNFYEEKDGSVKSRPVVAGFGPSGMFAGLILAEAGAKPIIIERGQPVEQRMKDVEEFWNTWKLNVESNVQFGEGGAGTFSDGKLTTGIKDVRISKVLKELVEAGADNSITYKQKPHIGTDKLVDVVRNIRYKIEALGGEVRFGTKLEDIVFDEEQTSPAIKAIKTNNGEIETNSLILAIGHSARDTFQMLFDRNLEMVQKPFSIGVRIEHPQEMINESQYGNAALAEKLGAADYKLNHRCENGRGVYTFCMCPGGHVINASSEVNTAVTNGMSNSARDSETANSGLLVDVRTEDFSSDHPLAGVEFQRKYEKLAFEMGKGTLPKTRYESFRDNDSDCVRNSLPKFASEAIIEAMPHLGKKLKGFDSEDAVMTAVETRSSSPVRVIRGENMQASVKGVFPAGEGPGYAGGIMSAAVDGIKVAEQVLAVIIS